MSDFLPGEIVDIHIKGVMIAESRCIDGLRFEYDGDAAEIALTPSVHIERAAPSEWPPLERDVWRDRDGDLWLGRRLPRDGDLTVGLVCSRVEGKSGLLGASVEPERVLRKHSPMSLVHREEVPDAS